MNKIYFNWNELKRNSGGNFSGIIILAYCLSIGYNKVIAGNSKYLLEILKLDAIPLILFQQRHLAISNGQIISLYKCKEKLTYFTNASFCVANCSTAQKGRYLYLLSHRPINSEEPYIPKHYVDEKFWKNPFIRAENDRLYFIPESITRA